MNNFAANHVCHRPPRRLPPPLHGRRPQPAPRLRAGDHQDGGGRDGHPLGHQDGCGGGRGAVGIMLGIIMVVIVLLLMMEAGNGNNVGEW